MIKNNRDYIHNTEKFFNENNMTKLKKDPTHNYNQQIKKDIKACKYLLNNNDKKYNKMIKIFAPVLT